MIISHKLKLIFIHIPKNAGTFIWGLLKKLDENIVIHWNTKDSSRTTLHNKAVRIKELCDFDYSEYTIFCIIRNPFERVISLYNYIKGNKNYPTHNLVKNQSFKEFIEYSFSKKDFLETNYIIQCEFMYDENNNLLIDKIIRYERLHEDLKEMLTSIDALNIKDAELVNALTSTRPTATGVCLDIYTNQSIKYIMNLDSETQELILKNIPEVENEMCKLGYNMDY